MTYREITSKMAYHAAQAREAWNHGNLTCYIIENARFNLALRALQRRDKAACALYYATVNTDPEQL